MGFGSILISEEVKGKHPKVSYADLYQVFYYSGDPILVFGIFFRILWLMLIIDPHLFQF